MIYLTVEFAISIYLFVGRQTARRHHMPGIVTSKSGNIDGLNVTAIAAIAPCVGGLIIWYAQTGAIAREAVEQQDNNEPAAADQISQQ